MEIVSEMMIYTYSNKILIELLAETFNPLDVLRMAHIQNSSSWFQARWQGKMNKIKKQVDFGTLNALLLASSYIVDQCRDRKLYTFRRDNFCCA